MDTPRRPLISASADATRIYSLEEEERLAANLRDLTLAVHRGDLRKAYPAENLLVHFHARLFDGVRSHAGRHRCPGFGSEYLTFGPNRSLHRDEVAAVLAEVFGRLRTTLSHYDANQDDPDFEKMAISLAAWAHAEIIRCHPFEDGNGRTSRLILDWTLVRLGLRPIPVITTKPEYNECLNHFFRTRDIAPLCDLLVALYPFPGS